MRHSGLCPLQTTSLCVNCWALWANHERHFFNAAQEQLHTAWVDIWVHKGRPLQGMVRYKQSKHIIPQYSSRGTILYHRSFSSFLMYCMEGRRGPWTTASVPPHFSIWTRRSPSLRSGTDEQTFVCPLPIMLPTACPSWAIPVRTTNCRFEFVGTILPFEIESTHSSLTRSLTACLTANQAQTRPNYRVAKCRLETMKSD